jgi:hypothetical protein
MKTTIAVSVLWLALLGGCVSNETEEPNPRQSSQQTAAAHPPVPNTHRLPELGGCSGRSAGAFSGKRVLVAIQARPCVVRSHKPPQVKLFNLGEASIGYGPAYMIEKRTPDGWMWINRGAVFTQPLFTLAPFDQTPAQALVILGKDSSMVQLTPGVYRVTKRVQEISGDTPTPHIAVTARFTVAEDRDG